MPFLELMGWTIPILNGQANEKHDQWGFVKSSWDNNFMSECRGIPRRWELKIKFQEEETANTLEGLISGRGHHFDFDSDAFSSAGLGPELGSTYTIGTNSVFGDGSLEISGGNSVTWNAELGNLFTIIYWRNTDTTPEQVAVRSDCKKWFDGVNNDFGVNSELTVSSGAVALSEGSYDDLVILPFEASEEFIQAFYASGEPFNDLPCLVVTGDFVDGEEVEVLGKLKNQLYLQHQSTATWKNNSRELDVTLEEKIEFEQAQTAKATNKWVFDDNKYLSGSDVINADGYLEAVEAGVSPTYDTGPFGFGRAVCFIGGGNGRFEVDEVVGESLEGLNFLSLAVWVKVTTLGSTNTICGQDISGSQFKFGLETTSGDFFRISVTDLATNSVNQDISTTNIVADQWFAVVAVWDLIEAESRLYVDGVLESTDTLSNITQDFFSDETNGPFVIGNDQGGADQLIGCVASVALYNRLLSDREVYDHYQKGRNGVFR